MKIKKLAAFAAAAGGAALVTAAAGTKVVVSRLKGSGSISLNKGNDSINLNNVTEKQMAGAKPSSEIPAEEVILALVEIFEEKMPYAGGHSKRVAEIARAIGENMGFADLAGLYYAAMLHDIGKIYMDKKLLNKSKLSMTEEELSRWHNHPGASADIVRRIPRLAMYAEAVAHHHERFDGSGYPDGLKGEEIPIVARIIEVADAFEAMSNERPGREAYPREYIVAELTKCSGTQFDPHVVKATKKVIADGYSEE